MFENLSQRLSGVVKNLRGQGRLTEANIQDALREVLKQASVLAELHVYAGAAHDFGVRASDQPCSTWTETCPRWSARARWVTEK